MFNNLNIADLQNFYVKLKEVNKERLEWESKEAAKTKKENDRVRKERELGNILGFPGSILYMTRYPEVKFTFDLFLEYLAGGQEVLDALLPPPREDD